MRNKIISQGGDRNEKNFKSNADYPAYSFNISRRVCWKR